MQAVRGLPRQRRAGRRDRLDRPQHAGARARPATPRACCSSTRPSGSSASRRSCARQGVDVQVVVIHEGAAAGANAVGATPPAAVGRADRRHRRQAAGHDGRPRDRRVTRTGSANTVDRPDPGGRGRQRRRQLLGRAAAGQGRRRGVGGRGDAHRQEPRRRAARRRARRSSTRPTPTPRPLRNEVIGTPERRPPARQPGAPEGVRDGQPGRRRDAGEVRRASRRRSRTPAACAQDLRMRADARRRGSRRDHLGRGVRRAAVRQPAR